MVLMAAGLGTAGLRAQTPPDVVTSNAAYTLRPGDIVQIDVWGQDDFSGKFQIDETGHLLYPVVGNIDTRNHTIGELRDIIRTGLEGVFNRPFVTITPLFRIAVLGEVQSPGLITVDPTLSILDVVAMAGGPNSRGDLNRIQLLRNGTATRLRFGDQTNGQSLAEIGVHSGDQILVKKKSLTREDWSLIVAFLQVALSVAILIRTF